MFEVNNEEEYPLLAKDFLEATEELKKTGKLSPETRASLEKVLPLEHFELAQTDSVMYYAFAEDNKPEMAQRTQTDLRFIDIRPFHADVSHRGCRRHARRAAGSAAQEFGGADCPPTVHPQSDRFRLLAVSRIRSRRTCLASTR